MANISKWTIAVLLATVPLVAACDIFDDGGAPESARLELASDSAEQVVLIISTDFELVPPAPDVGGPSEIQIIVADTAEYSSPHVMVWDLGARTRIYVKMLAPPELKNAVTLKVAIDDGTVALKVVSAPGDSTSIFYTYTSY